MEMTEREMDGERRDGEGNERGGVMLPLEFRRRLLPLRTFSHGLLSSSPPPQREGAGNRQPT